MPKLIKNAAWYNSLRRFIVNSLIEHYELADEVLAPQAELSLLSSLWENPTFRKYSTLREDYLIRQGMEKFIAGSLVKADALAGQLFEVRELRQRSRNAYKALRALKDARSRLSKEQE